MTHKDAVKGAGTGETPAPDTSGVLAALEADLAPMPGPERGRLAAAVAAGEACASCHDDEARSWARSRHHLAATNGAFAETFAAEPAGFCQDCHAPEAAPGKAPSPEVRELGVGCVTCHVTPRLHESRGSLRNRTLPIKETPILNRKDASH